ncbi:hypothetical protein B0H63DRAFT_484004 [Podospora didyma]|uniref:Uncharacterized protein n=1 Tax=Podospora didyma TaxID=330526 RepID=A0AAE0N628_9PEZI|nr:hypothetical protein B0H63DRAFT_484004 [Podospora didyma]
MPMSTSMPMLTPMAPSPTMTSDPATLMAASAPVGVDLVDFVRSPFASGVAAIIGKELIQWLGSKGISDESFCRVMATSKALASPNSNGLAVLDRVHYTLATIIRGVRLMTPGAFGRAVLQDPKLCWMATTVAVFLRHHDLCYATKVLSRIVVRSIENPKDVPLMQVLVDPIMQEAVKSIALHTTNQVPNLIKLPGVLSRLGHHLLTADALFGSIAAIQEIKADGVSVRMQVCAIDLLDWIYHHWNGHLMVETGNPKERIFSEDLMPDQPSPRRVLLVTIDTLCSAVWHCRNYEHEKRSLVVFISTSSEPSFFADGATTRANLPKTSVDRSNLYEIADRNPFIFYHAVIYDKEDAAALKAASAVVASVMALRVRPGRRMHLEIQSHPDANPRAFNDFQWWAVRVPSLLQQRCRSPLERPHPIRALYWAERPVEAQLEMKGLGPYEILPVADIRPWGSYQLPAICNLYPEITEAVSVARHTCRCPCCVRASSAWATGGDDTCRQGLMAAQVLLYIAHALAEAAGVDTISNANGPESAKDLINATIQLLGTIAVDGYIPWRLWFRLAASAITGLPQDIWAKRPADGDKPIFVVSGGMTVAPVWFDLDQEVQPNQSWGVKILTGVVAGVRDEVALVQAEPTGRADCYPPDALLPFLPRNHINGADGRVDIQTLVWRVDDCVYQHAASAQGANVARILSPWDVYFGYMYARRPTCPHVQEHGEITRWPPSGGSAAHFADDWALRQNILIGLSADKCAVKTDQCCLGCLLYHSEQFGCAAIYFGPRTKKMAAPRSPQQPTNGDAGRIIPISRPTWPDSPGL